MSTDLFPLPTPLHAALAPTVWPGTLPDSAEALQRVLKDNHERHHIFFNEIGFHNHIAHHVLTIWALGASAPVIEAAYKADASFQRPAFEAPEQITQANFSDHLGDERFYRAYLKFFEDSVLEQGVAKTVEQYVFSSNYNHDADRDGKPQPQMLDRFLAGVVHPMIHTGFGLEFGIPGVVAEGLAETAIHPVQSPAILPPSLFSTSSASVNGLTSQLASLSVLAPLIPNSKPNATIGTHAFTIMARILKDPLFDRRNASKEENSIYESTLHSSGDELRKYLEEWTVNGSDPKDVERKIEEIVWTNVLIYSVGGYRAGEVFRNDFFTMHLVNSTLFVPSITAFLTPASKSVFLRAYFAVSITWWIARGRPAFDIPAFFAADTAHPAPPGPVPTPGKDVLPTPSSSDALTPNPWLPIVQSAIVHPDDHIGKFQRTLAHWAELYGARHAGLPDFAATELVGAEKLDGTLFIRAAGLTAERVGRVREGEEAEAWSRVGFYDV